MASDEETETASRFHDLESIKALLLDPTVADGSQVKDRMIDVGLRGVGTCSDAASLPGLVQEKQPDLLVIDLDGERDAICKVIQEIRSQTIKTENPFAVIVGVTEDDGRKTVEAALEAGVDAMLAKPVSPAAMRACLREQIENRADFIATADYVGPDRRPEDREASDEELVSVEVPNTLQSKATGETDGEAADDKIARTLRSLGAQRSWHLARKIARLSENARKALASGADFPLLGECAEAIESALGKIESLDAELNLDAMRKVIASARAALAALLGAGDDISARHFELLRVHSDAMVVAMEQDDSVRDVLLTELARAVAAVGGEAPEGRDGAGDEDGAERRYSWKVRFRAWWEGVDPGDIVAA